MYGRKVKLRFLFVVIILITLILTTFLILKSLEENVVYFQSPSEIKSLSEIDKSKIRVGGMVKKNTLEINNQEIECSAKIRSTQKENPGTLNIFSDSAEFIFDSNILTTSPGQACVFYLNEQVLGGGWITKKI